MAYVRAILTNALHCAILRLCWPFERKLDEGKDEGGVISRWNRGVPTVNLRLSFTAANLGIRTLRGGAMSLELGHRQDLD